MKLDAVFLNLKPTVENRILRLEEPNILLTKKNPKPKDLRKWEQLHPQLSILSRVYITKYKWLQHHLSVLTQREESAICWIRVSKPINLQLKLKYWLSSTLLTWQELPSSECNKKPSWLIHSCHLNTLNSVVTVLSHLSTKKAAPSKNITRLSK